jgi:hypothetical protein
VGELIGACERFRMVLCDLIKLGAQDQWWDSMLGPVDIVLLQRSLTKSGQVETVSSAWSEVSESYYAQDSSNE